MLSSLMKMHLSGNQLIALPAEIGKLGSLTTMLVSRNQLKALPAEIGQLGSLMYLVSVTRRE